MQTNCLPSLVATWCTLLIVYQGSRPNLCGGKVEGGYEKESVCQNYPLFLQAKVSFLYLVFCLEFLQVQGSIFPTNSLF